MIQNNVTGKHITKPLSMCEKINDFPTKQSQIQQLAEAMQKIRQQDPPRQQTLRPATDSLDEQIYENFSDLYIELKWLIGNEGRGLFRASNEINDLLTKYPNKKIPNDKIVEFLQYRTIAFNKYLFDKIMIHLQNIKSIAGQKDIHVGGKRINKKLSKKSSKNRLKKLSKKLSKKSSKKPSKKSSKNI